MALRAHRRRADESFTLRYRVLVHTGRWDPERLRREHEHFSLTSAVDDETRPRFDEDGPGPRTAAEG